jgi:hypothetical protein
MGGRLKERPLCLAGVQLKRSTMSTTRLLEEFLRLQL